MSRKSLAVVYRPRSFSEVCEQQEIITILENQIRTKTFGGSFLFVGPAGCGKTTTARILANEINEGKGTPIEIDGASNNGVDNVRDIINRSLKKSFDSEYKVFIVDECHMITVAGWNAFLKTLEEPPAKTIFIFCTTDPQKIPATIISRVPRFDFQRISFEGIVNRLKYVIEKENENQDSKFDKITYEDGAIQYIAKTADGAMRDSLTMLDKCLSLNNNLTLENVVKSLNSVNYDIMFDIVNNILDYKESEVIATVESLYKEGVDLKLFIKQLTLFVLDVRKYQLFQDFKYIQIPQIFEDKLKNVTNVDSCFYKFLLKELNNLSNTIKWEHNIKPMVELELMLLCKEGN